MSTALQVLVGTACIAIVAVAGVWLMSGEPEPAPVTYRSMMPQVEQAQAIKDAIAASR